MSVQLSSVLLLVIPLVPGKDLLLVPAPCTGVIQQRSWEQNHSSEATIKNLVSSNYMLNATVLVTSQILFCLLCQMRKDWHASLSEDRRALLGKAWGTFTFVYHMGMQMSREAERKRVEKSESVTKQYIFPHGEGVQEDCLQGLLCPQSFCDQKGALFTHVSCQGLAKILTL